MHLPERLGDGFYAIIGWDDQDKRYSAWLFTSDGAYRHRWPVAYDALDADGPSNRSDAPHAFHVMPDGSVIVGFDKGDLMVRLDACGREMWRKEGAFHHAVSRADDGSFWTWRSDGTAYGHFHYLHNFDGDTGLPVSEIGLIEDVIRPLGEGSHIFSVRPDYPFQVFEKDPARDSSEDLFHPNDIEELSTDMASHFPMFAPGDLLLSFRNINLVAVAESRTGRIKWASNGPWVRQHDPDFFVDGTISVYSNNPGTGRSEIIRIDPATRATRNWLFDGAVACSADGMGVHQYLPNGNIRLVVPGEGRVLEVTAQGEVVLEFNNLVGDRPQLNGHVANAMWLPTEYFDPLPVCAD